MRKKLTAIFFALLCVFMLAGCKKKTLEAKIKKEDLQKLNDQAYELYVKPNPLIRDYHVEVEGNTIYYKAYFAAKLSDAQVLEIKASGIDLVNTIFQVKDGIEKTCGVRPETISYIFYDVDGNVIHEVSA
ncbi:MAG: hypothetical protein IKR22_07495 [Clostridiales bacterium]|nr:hypothetical protein [Clostridiales bacterium]